MLAIVAESCPTKIFLANPEMNREVYREAFHLNDTELDLIGGLVPPGQMLIRKAQTSKKVHLNVDSVSHWMATNNARDNLKKQDYFDRFGIADGLRHLAEDYPFQRARWPDQPLQRTIKEKRCEPTESHLELLVSRFFHRRSWRKIPHARCSITRRTSFRSAPS